jgi:hypothetical protein
MFPFMLLKPFKRPLRDAVPHLRCLHDTHLEPTHVLVWKAASTVLLISVVICFAFLVVSPSSLVMKDPMEVCSLSRGVMLLLFNSYPPHYKVAFAFSIIPYPPIHRLSLRLAFPCGRMMGLPRFAFEPKMG